MTHPTLSFKCALITGGGGGIGRALAEYFISLDKKVIIAGRTESNLKTTAAELGHGTQYYVLDTGSISNIPDIVARITREHPDLDCLINNAGVQRPLQFTQNDFLEKADQEININVRGPMHLAVSLLPHLKQKPNATIINVSSVLGIVPFSIINPVYNGTKAFLRFHTMNMRTQLREQMPNVKVVEIAPPTVHTELHREREDPNDNDPSKNKTSLTLEEFMKSVKEGMEDERDVISAGPGVELAKKWDEQFGEQYRKAEKN